MLLEKRDIGLVEDDPIMGESIVQRLVIEGASVTWWRSKQEALSGLAFNHPDAVICDIRLADGSGEDLYRLASQRGRAPPFLFMTAFGDVDQAVRLMRAGAGDYLTKPFQMDDFLSRLGMLAVSSAQLSGGLGNSPAMAALSEPVAALSRARVPALITGEPGSGKAHLARLIHDRSAERAEPFMSLDCRVLASELEETLFGKDGLLSSGRRGSVLLRDLTVVTDKVQARLAEWLANPALQTRLVATSTRDPAALLGSGRLRTDLRYALAGANLEVPPLRARRSELPALIASTLADSAAVGSPRKRLSEEALAACLTYEWPGNFHELRSRIGRGAMLSQSSTITLADLFEDRVTADVSHALSPLSLVRGDAERDRIEQALREAKGHIGETARRLRVSRTTLWSKMKKLGISARARDVQKTERSD